jgi:glutamate carboxypeptidase
MTDSSPQSINMVDLLQRLVETESPSHDKLAVDRVGAIVAEECARLGAAVEMHEQAEAGNQVVARWDSGPGTILLLAHMDTVFPLGTIQKMPFYEKDGKIFGPGTSDMKGGISVGLSAIAAARKAGTKLPHPITALFTSDEEIGSHSSQALIETLAKESVLVLVLEPGLPDGSIKIWRKGVGEYTFTVHGRAAHAGADHEKGRNAIEELAHQVIAIQKMTDYVRGTTLNVGMIQGGTATNVIPEEATAVVDLRVLQPGEAERIHKALHALRPVLEGTTLQVTGGLEHPPMPLDETMKQTFAKAKSIAGKIGMNLKASGTGGASDGNHVAALGIPVLDGLGPTGEGYHSEREFIFKSSLQERVDLLVALLQEW